VFPVGDWQFWVATALVGAVVGAGLWRVRPRRKRETRVTLTIGKSDTSRAE
jgi:hypothetical protein